MSKKKLKAFKEQWDSIAVITVMMKGQSVQMTSEGCGPAGEYADALINLAASVFESTKKVEVTQCEE